VDIIAESVQFLGSRGDGEGGGSGNQFVPAGASEGGADFPAATDDDIPF
jgi:single-stranded DNA-binding protein